MLVMSFTAGWIFGEDFKAGAARQDITPEGAIRLTGYASRTSETQEVAQRLWAKALAISTTGKPPLVLIGVDNCGVTADIVEEVATWLREKAALPRENLAVCSSHTHNGPMLSRFAPNIFVGNDTPEQRERIVAYAKILTEKLKTVALDAIRAQRAATLEWNEGRVCFAANRRTRGGPVDHALPVLCARDRDTGKPLAIVANYACHCTTLGDANVVHGDWSGCAQVELENQFPGAVALITVGTGADANPSPRGKIELAAEHGRELSVEAAGLVRNRMRPLTAAPVCRLERIELPFAPPPTREQWQQRAGQGGIVGYHAKRQLEKLDRGETLLEKLPYTVQTWCFGDDLAMVFLAGEVVVDYSRWLKDRFDGGRLWVTAYANDVPCYIPSRRILEEGGYEAQESLWYYDRPARLAPETEQIIENAAASLLPGSYRLTETQREMPPALPPQESQASLRVGGGLEIELVAAEPLVADPICIDWDARGRLWVLELSDYPKGVDGNWKAGSSLKILTDTNGDGLPDKAQVFLDGLKFPTGFLCRGRGAFVCAAPDILWAEDTDGDGRADRVEKRYSGWSTENYNARVNGLALGLDNWIHGSGGLIGGRITPGNIDLSGRDFRFDPASGVIEAASGKTQQGRPRDDWDHWFGCDNSTLLWHYPLPDGPLQRNAHVAPPAARVNPLAKTGEGPLFPTSRTLERYNEPHMANRTTSGCGVAIYRDDWLGEAYSGNAFTCEPVHNLVRRTVLADDGVTFSGSRAPDEPQREFFSSRDNWSRFVQARTGPDGALWIVDMYRFVIEHPTWIPEERQKRLDLRAGSDRGRIYRLKVPGKPLRSVRDLTALSDADLAAALATRNGTERDRVHMEILLRGRSSGLAALLQSPIPQVRGQALAVRDGIGSLTAQEISAALKDGDAHVREIAARLAGKYRVDLTPVISDPVPKVAAAAALASTNPDQLSSIALTHGGDPWIRAAVFSSAADCAEACLQRMLQAPAQTPGRQELIAGFAASVKHPDAALDLLLASPEAPLRLLAELCEKMKEHMDGPRKNLLEARGKAAMSEGDPDALRLLGAIGLPDEALLGIFGDTGATAVLEIVTRRGGANNGQRLTEFLQAGTPAMRSAIVHALSSRREWNPLLVKAVRAGRLLPAEIPLVDQQAVIRVLPEAAGLFPARSTASVGDRMKPYAATAGLSGNLEAGEAVFQKNCATCHAANGIGHAVGPDIAAYRAKPVLDLVMAIVDPNAVIEPAHLACEVVTTDGRTRAGIIREETATGLVVVQPAGIAETLLRKEVARIQPLGVSLMPEGLEKLLAPQDMADLHAWLRSGGPAAWASATPAQTAAARKTFLDSSPLRLGKIIKSGASQTYSSWMGSLPLHCCRALNGEQELAWESTPVAAGGDSATFRFAAGMGYVSQPAGNFHLRINRRVALNLAASLANSSWRSADGSVVGQWRVLEANAEDACGILTISVPLRWLEPGKPALFELTGSDSGSLRWIGLYVP